MPFSMSHSVTLPHPLPLVFPALSEPQHMERLQRLTPEAQEFKLLPSDRVQLVGGLAGFFQPDHPSNPQGLPRPLSMASIDSNDAETSEAPSVERAKFEFSGTTSLLWGLIQSPLSVTGAQIVENQSRTVVFESRVEASGIQELKVRTFKEAILEDGSAGTVVKETVWGTCPLYLAPLLKIIAPRVHREHMELYHKLF